MASVFGKSLEELLQVNVAQAALFLFGLGLTMPPQKALKPPGHCSSMLEHHYNMVQRLSFFLVFATFGSFVATGFVKTRVPVAAHGGLGSVVSAKRRMALRLLAAIGLLLNVAASIFAFSTYTFLLQVRTGMFECLPVETRVGVYTVYVLVGALLCVVYYVNGKAIVLEE